MTKPAVVAAAVLLAAAGCSADEPTTSPRVERCVDRLLSGADSRVAADDSSREYARATYCERFHANGWVYEDGALSIAAQEWLDDAGTCVTAIEEEPARTVPCDEFDQFGDPVRTNCALLRHVRQTEIRAYVEKRNRDGRFACDDGTPVEELGVP